MADNNNDNDDNNSNDDEFIDISKITLEHMDKKLFDDVDYKDKLSREGKKVYQIQIACQYRRGLSRTRQARRQQRKRVGPRLVPVGWILSIVLWSLLFFDQ